MVFNHNILIINVLNILGGVNLLSKLSYILYPRQSYWALSWFFFIQPLCVIANEVKQSRTTGIRYGLLRRSSSQ